MEDFSFISRKKVFKTTDTACGFLPAVDVVHRVTKPDITLKAYEEENVLKLFMHDTGLLSALSGIDSKIMLEETSVFSMFKSALTEQYVLQELQASSWRNIEYYSTERSTAEINFLLEFGENIIPFEVKSGINTKAKSLSAYREKYSPTLSLRSSLLPYKDQEWLINVPLYAVSRIGRICEEKLQ